MATTPEYQCPECVANKTFVYGNHHGVPFWKATEPGWFTEQDLNFHRQAMHLRDIRAELLAEQN